MKKRYDDDHAKKIGQKIRQGRKAKGLTLEDLGQAVGLSAQAISQYERGVRSASNETLKRINDVLTHYENATPPTLTVVAYGVFDQIRWERDIAISQLETIGIGLGQKMPDMVKVIRCKDCEEYIPWLNGCICGRLGSYYGDTKPDDFCSKGVKKSDAHD